MTALLLFLQLAVVAIASHLPQGGLTKLFAQRSDTKTGSDDAFYYLDKAHEWIPAALIANASRSPCPMLNTLANHNFLPRDGRSFSKDDLNNAQVDALNMTPDLASGTTDAMVAKLGLPRNASDSFDLAFFNEHNFTEHDASLTRYDSIQTNSSMVDPGLVRKFLDDSKTDYLDTQSIGRSRARREAESKDIGSPQLEDSLVSFAQLESSFITLIFGHGGAGTKDKDVNETACERKAPKDQVGVWLREERFPTELGFNRSTQALTKAFQTALINFIQKSHDELVGSYS